MTTGPPFSYTTYLLNKFSRLTSAAFFHTDKMNNRRSKTRMAFGECACVCVCLCVCVYTIFVHTHTHAHTHTHTHTHTHRERERERERERRPPDLGRISGTECTQTHTHTHTHKNTQRKMHTKRKRPKTIYQPQDVAHGEVR